MPVIERYWLKVDKTGPVAVTTDPAVAYDWAGSWPDGFKRDVIAVTPEGPFLRHGEAVRRHNARVERDAR